MILAGDVGGTKTVLALFEATGDGVEGRGEAATFASREFGSLDEILKLFLRERSPGALRAVCIGVAGAVLDGAVQATNLPWRLDEAGLAAASGAPRAKLLNDLEAAAHGMLALDASKLESLNPKAGPRRLGNVAVIAAGTGLGEALLAWDGERHHAVASEGGHGDFAPRDEREIELFRFLRAEVGDHVSYERVLSGPGLHDVYRFLCTTGFAPESVRLTERLAAGDPAAAISHAALEDGDPLCLETLRLFCGIYGAEAGNLALRVMSLGGVFVGGGIAPKILPILREGAFLRAFTAKGRFRGVLEQIPLWVVLEPLAPVLGAAHYARRLL